MALERRIYRNPKVHLTAVSGLVRDQLREHFGRSDVRVISNGVATNEFNPLLRMERRALARTELGFNPTDFVLLLLGNDWVKKGVPCLFRALAMHKDLPVRLIVVGRDDFRLFDADLERLGIKDNVQFGYPRSDVMHYYAAADAYVGPSIEDAYGLPILEAMACGLPVIASVRAGASEAIQHRVNGLLLQDPTDAKELGRYIEELIGDRALRERLGESAQVTARSYNWERNAEDLMDFLARAAAQRHQRSADPL